MIAEKQTKSANFLRIIAILKSLRDDSKISIQEYSRAKKNTIRNLPAPIFLLRIDISIIRQCTTYFAPLLHAASHIGSKSRRKKSILLILSVAFLLKMWYTTVEKAEV